MAIRAWHRGVAIVLGSAGAWLTSTALPARAAEAPAKAAVFAEAGNKNGAARRELELKRRRGGYKHRDKRERREERAPRNDGRRWDDHKRRDDRRGNNYKRRDEGGRRNEKNRRWDRRWDKRGRGW